MASRMLDNLKAHLEVYDDLNIDVNLLPESSVSLKLTDQTATLGCRARSIPVVMHRHVPLH